MCKTLKERAENPAEICMGDTYICAYMEEGNTHTHTYICIYMYVCAWCFFSCKSITMAHKVIKLILEISLKLKDVSIYLDLLYKVQSLQFNEQLHLF